MSHQKNAACIEACYACATACNHCAAACLQEPDVTAMVRCIANDMDCAAICTLAAGSMARGSEDVMAICKLCADSCDRCAQECSKHAMEHCQACAAACRRCAEECRSMSS